jgi:hypothetical protein
MSQATLTFVSSQSINQFKAAKMLDSLPIKRNPKTNKLFLAFAGGTGAVAVNYDSNKPKLISLVRDLEGTEFYMLHNEGIGAETVETL